MSWDPNYDNSAYGNYGNYGDPNQYGVNPQPAAPAVAPVNAARRTPTASYGRASTPLQQSYDATYSYDGYSSAPMQQGAVPAAAAASFYNPNEYNAGGAAHGRQQQFMQPSPTPFHASAVVGAHQGRNSPLPPVSPSYYAAPPGQVPAGAPGVGGFPIPGFGEQMNPMVANMAMQYGQDMMGKGQEEIKRNLDKYISIGQLKYYFAVDNLYVGKKLGLLLFPFTHSDWSIQYNQEEPVQPKFDLNAPDLYIPAMAYVTYVLVVGYIMGLRNAFSPDQLATTASSALVWLVLEIGCIYLSLTLMNIATNLCKWDVLSFSTYKFVGMIAVLLAGLLSQSRQVFYGALLYVSAALAFFFVRTLKLRIEPEVHGMPVHGKRKLYMILMYAGLQPLLIWWMTSYFAPIVAPLMPVGSVHVEEP